VRFLRPLGEGEGNGADPPQPHHQPRPSPYQVEHFDFLRLAPIRLDPPAAYDHLVAIETLRSLDLPVFLPSADDHRITRSCEVHRCDIFRHVSPPLAQAAAGHFLREAAGHDIAAYIDLPRPPGGEAPTAGTLTPALSLPGRGRSAHIASREQPTLVRRARALWARSFLRDRAGAAALVSLAPTGGEGLGEGGRE